MLTLEAGRDELYCAAGVYGILVVNPATGHVKRTLRSYHGRDLDPRYEKLTTGPLAFSRAEHAKFCIEASAVAIFWRGSGDEQLLVQGKPPFSSFTLDAKQQLFRIDLNDGHDRGEPVEAHAFGLVCGKLPGEFPKAYLADINYIHVVDLSRAEKESRTTAKAFDVAFENEIIYVACHGYGSGDCVDAFSPETGRLFAESDTNVIEGGIVTWHGEVFGANGSSVSVMDTRTLRMKRTLEVRGYRNGPMAINDHGLFLRLGDFGGTSAPSFESGGEIALVDPNSGRTLHQITIDFPA
jgi:hypothetical protein